MPLLNIIGVDSLHRNFNVCFGLSIREREEDFEWHLNCLKKLQEKYNIGQPSVILSDFCRALKNAAKAVYPGVPQQLCVWHIMKNVNHHIKKKWVQEGDPTPVQTALCDTVDDLNGPGPDPPSYSGPGAAPAGSEGVDDDAEEELEVPGR
jgi:hypothetical protein